MSTLTYSKFDTHFKRACRNLFDNKKEVVNDEIHLEFDCADLMKSLCEVSNTDYIDGDIVQIISDSIMGEMMCGEFIEEDTLLKNFKLTRADLTTIFTNLGKTVTKQTKFAMEPIECYEGPYDIEESCFGNAKLILRVV